MALRGWGRWSGRPAEVRLLSWGRGSGPSTSREESVGQPQGAEAASPAAPTQVEVSRVLCGASPEQGTRLATRPRMALGVAGGGGPSPPRVLPLLQREARALRVPCLPLVRVSCSPRQSCFPSSSPPAAWGAEEPRPGEDCTACTPTGAHVCTGTLCCSRRSTCVPGATVRVPGPRLRRDPGPSPAGLSSGAQGLMVPRAPSQGCPQRVQHLLAPGPCRAP